MQRIEFNGIQFGNGSKFIITHVDGFASGDGEGQKIRHIDTDGTQTRDYSFEERIVTIDGHILFDSLEERRKLRRGLIQAMNPKESPVPLYYWDGSARYFAYARADSLPQWGDFMMGAEPFTCYLSIPEFYLLSDKVHEADIYRRINQFSVPFVLPVVATVRTNQADIVNAGDVAAECTIHIYCTGTQQGDGGVTVSNVTMGQALTLNYAMTEGEEVVIDTGQCTAVSSISGNIINRVDGASEWFLLQRGVNRISASVTSGGDVTVSVRFRDKYLGV